MSFFAAYLLSVHIHTPAHLGTVEALCTYAFFATVSCSYSLCCEDYQCPLLCSPKANSGTSISRTEYFYEVFKIRECKKSGNVALPIGRCLCTMHVAYCIAMAADVIVVIYIASLLEQCHQRIASVDMAIVLLTVNKMWYVGLMDVEETTELFASCGWVSEYSNDDEHPPSLCDAVHIIWRICV